MCCYKCIEPFIPSPEVILSILVESFRFSLSKKEVIWHMTHAIATATVPGSNRSQLPLIVERA